MPFPFYNTLAPSSILTLWMVSQWSPFVDLSILLCEFGTPTCNADLEHLVDDEERSLMNATYKVYINKDYFFTLI